MMNTSLNKKSRVVLIVVIAVAAAFALLTGSAFAGSCEASGAGSQDPLDGDARELDMKGERVFIAGDSIQNKDRYNKYGAFIHRACRRLGAKKIHNVAKSGATLADAHNGFVKSTYRQVMGNLKKIRKCRYVFISAGTNDYGGGAFGWARASSASKSLDKMIKKIHKVAPTAKIIVVTPINRYKYRNGALRNCDKLENRLDNKTLMQYRKIIKKTAGKKAYRDYVMVVDGEKLIAKKKMKSLKYSWDRLHPKAGTAKKILAPAFIRCLKGNADWLLSEPEPEKPQKTNKPSGESDQPDQNDNAISEDELRIIEKAELGGSDQPEQISGGEWRPIQSLSGQLRQD